MLVFVATKTNPKSSQFLVKCRNKKVQHLNQSCTFLDATEAIHGEVAPRNLRK